MPLGHSPVSSAPNHYQICWSNSLSSSGHPTASVCSEPGQQQITSCLALIVWPEPVAQVPPLAGGMWWVPPGIGSEALVASLGMEELPPTMDCTSPSLAADRTQVSSQDLTQMCKKGREITDRQVIQTQIYWNETLFIPLKGGEEQKTGWGEWSPCIHFSINCRFLAWLLSFLSSRSPFIMGVSPRWCWQFPLHTHTHTHRCTYPPSGFFAD